MKLLANFLICLFIPSSLAGNVYFNRLDHTDGLPQINIMSIYQDETGAMWFGTISGLCRYNGNSTQVFRSSQYPGLTQNDILSITGNGDGAVYIKADHDLIRYDIAGEQFRYIYDEVAGMFYGNGELWFNVGDKIYVWSETDGEAAFYSDTGGVRGSVTALCVSDGNDVWIGGGNGLAVVRGEERRGEDKTRQDKTRQDKTRQDKTRQDKTRTGEVIYNNINVRSLYVDSEGLIWVGTENDGVYVLERNGSLKWRFMHVPDKNSISNNAVRTITEDGEGVVWVGTFFGLNSFDKSTGKWANFIHDDTRPHSLSHSSVFAIYRDTQNTIWVGTYFGGVNYFNPMTDIFNHYSASSIVEDRLSFPFVGKMTEDMEGNLWICTEGGGLNRLDLRSRKFTRYLYEKHDPDGTTMHNLKGIYHDSRTGKLYIGAHNTGMYIFDLKNRKSVLLRRPELAVRAIQPYKGSIIVLTRRGLHRIDTDTDTIVPFSDDEDLSALVNREYAHSFFIDSRDRLWFQASGLKCIDLNTKEKKEYLHDNGNPRSFGKFAISSFVETRSGELFFGTLGSGLFRYDPATDDFDNFTEKNNTQVSDFSYHICEMTSGDLLILHDNTISVFDPRTGNTIYRSVGNFPISGFFDGSSSYITRDGEVFIGGVNGLVSVKEARLMAYSPMDYRLYFDKLTVNGNRVLPGNGMKILSATLPLTDKIRLRHNQNNFSIEFATSNYSRHRRPTDYEYKLEGLDVEWNPALSEMITYANIKPGRYRLLVREINREKSDDEKKTCSLDIAVSPPFYNTVFAQVIYVLLSMAVVAGIIFFFMWRYRMRTTIEMERKDKENGERLNQMKLGFFTSVSHEFRTPLTLIMAQIEHMLSEGNLAPAMKNSISKVHDNATHMRDLISELLDFRKVEQGFYRLKVEPTDLVPYIDGIFRSFTEYADKHGIKYVYDFPVDGGVEAYIDRTQLKKAIYNLLSNAFKYTHDGGEITVSLRADEYIHIIVEDSGIGISSEELSTIFDRFYQVEYRTSGFSLGTGIGLALAKEIIESHRGEISVNSTLNEGSIFEIKLQRGSSHFGESELPYRPVTCEMEQGGVLPEVPVASNMVTADETSGQPYSILIVEDNEQLLSLLSEIFSEEYRVFTAVNGKRGLEMAEEHLPDIILTDVMMPVMSGNEMCSRLKNDVRLSHIPVVMLTALDSVGQTIESLMFGADDYVAKPFNVDLLKARCGGMVRNRRRLYRSVTRSRELAGVEVRNEHDRRFMERVAEIVRANFDNPSFDMNMLASEMGIARTNFYTKMKEISGMTPNEFTLVAKLRESTELLKNHLHLNISEISDRLGFSSTTYFSKCFKTFYGVSPIRWRKETTTQKNREEPTDK